MDKKMVQRNLKTKWKWKIFNGNEIGAMLAWWQMQTHFKQYGDTYLRHNLYFLASTVSSKMLRSIATSEGLSFEETLTGFKWMANRAYDLEQDLGKKVLLAYEEAIGFMCESQVLDKDGGEWGCDETRFYFEWGLLVRVGGEWASPIMPYNDFFSVCCGENSRTDTIFRRKGT